MKVTYSIDDGKEWPGFPLLGKGDMGHILLLTGHSPSGLQNGGAFKGVVLSAPSFGDKPAGAHFDGWAAERVTILAPGSEVTLIQE